MGHSVRTFHATACPQPRSLKKYLKFWMARAGLSREPVLYFFSSVCALFPVMLCFREFTFIYKIPHLYGGKSSYFLSN